MHHAMWLASVFGPLLFVLGLWVLVRKHDVEKVWTSIKATPSVLYLGAIMNLVIGFAVLATYREWSMHLAVLVTLLGYVQVIRGLLVLFAHDWVMKTQTKMMKDHRCHFYGVIPLVWGIGLIWAAFCC